MKILVMRYRFIGDTLLLIPFLKQLRAAYPDAVIDVLVGPNSGELLTYCPYINELITYDTTRKHRYEIGESKKSFWYYVKLLRNKHYDKAYVLKRSFSSALLAFLAGILKRIGFNTEARGFLLTTRVDYARERHERETFLDVLRADNIPVLDEPPQPEFWLSPAEIGVAQNIMQPYGNCRNILVSLSSSNRGKEWPEQHALTLIQKLLDDPKVMLHAIGAPSDQAQYEHIKRQLSVNLAARLQNWCGQFSLLESMAFLKHMNQVIGVDSGILHMASAMNVPVVALFGPMDERKWQPLTATVITEPVPCRPCNLAVPCAYQFRCMTELSPQKVLAACKPLLTP